MTLSYDHIRGHERVAEALRAAIRRGNVPHAYLFAGPEGVGKETMARVLFATLLCQAGGDAPCGQCSACGRFERGVHPDLRVVTAEGRSILIEQVREVTRLVHYPPIEGRYKCILVRDAETMLEPAANALLKTLEEPAAQTVFVLVSARPNLVLPTIVSRCQRLIFQAVPRGEIARLLVEQHGTDPERADTVAGMSEGSVARALDLVDGALVEERARWLDRLPVVPGMGVPELLAMAEDMAEQGKPRAADEEPGSEPKDETKKDKAKRAAKQKAQGTMKFELLLDLFRLWYRDLLLVTAGAPDEALTNRDRAADLRKQAAGTTAERIIEQLDLLQDTAAGLRVNVPARLSAERLLFALSRA